MKVVLDRQEAADLLAEALRALGKIKRVRTQVTFCCDHGGLVSVTVEELATTEESP